MHIPLSGSKLRIHGQGSGQGLRRETLAVDRSVEDAGRLFNARQKMDHVASLKLTQPCDEHASVRVAFESASSFEGRALRGL